MGHQPYKIGGASVEDEVDLFPLSPAAKIRKDQHSIDQGPTEFT